VSGNFGEPAPLPIDEENTDGSYIAPDNTVESQNVQFTLSKNGNVRPNTAGKFRAHQNKNSLVGQGSSAVLVNHQNMMGSASASGIQYQKPDL
jgi:hypothetical protein